MIYGKHNLNKQHFCPGWRQKQTHGLAALKLSLHLNLHWIGTLELWTRRGEQWHTPHCVSIPGWDVLCVTLRRSSLIYHNPANEGGALPLPQTKTLIERVLVWEVVICGPAPSSNVSKVTMGCNMCVVQKPEEQYRVMFQVSALSPLSRFHLFLSVFKRKH